MRFPGLPLLDALRRGMGTDPYHAFVIAPDRSAQSARPMPPQKDSLESSAVFQVNLCPRNLAAALKGNPYAECNEKTASYPIQPSDDGWLAEHFDNGSCGSDQCRKPNQAKRHMDRRHHNSQSWNIGSCRDELWKKGNIKNTHFWVEDICQKSAAEPSC